MFTIKVIRGTVTKLSQAVEVKIKTLRPNELSEIIADDNSFYIANPNKPRPKGFDDNVELWSEAYIENAAGSTTQRVKFT